MGISLTRYGVYMPGQAPTYYDQQGQALDAGNQALQQQAAAQDAAPIMTSAPTTAMASNPDASPDVAPNVTMTGGDIQIPSAGTSGIPKIFKPSFQQASQDQYGNDTAVTPGLTKLGTLFKILHAAAEGGLAGQAASERVVAQSGGHRSGGFATGAEAAMDAPIRDAMQQQQMETGALENQQRKASIAMLPWIQQKTMADVQEAQGKAQAASLVTPRGGGVFDAKTKQYVPGAGPTEHNQNNDQQAFDYLTSTADPQLGRPLNPAEALGRIAQMKQDVKPDSAAVAKQGFQATMQKVSAEGLVTPDAMTSLPKLTAAVKASKTITADEKNAALSYLASTTTPASQGSMANLRIEGLGSTRGVSSIYDTKTGKVGPVTWEELNRAAVQEPGRYISGSPTSVINPDTGEVQVMPSGLAMSGGAAPAGAGAKAMSAHTQLNEMHVAAQQARDAINNLDRPMNPYQISKLTMAMRSDNPSVFKTEIDTLLGSKELTPAQQDFVTWIAQLHERAMSLRSVAGMGQGSEQMRQAILATLPGVRSGNKQLMIKQLNAFENQVSLLEKGVPKVKGQPQAQPSNPQTAPEKPKYAPGFSPIGG